MKDKRLIISIVLLIIFVILVIFVKLDLTTNIDTFIYDIVTIKQNRVLTTVYKFFTFIGSIPFMTFLTFFLLLFISFILKTNKGLIISIVVFLSAFVNNIVKLIIGRERPEVLKLVSTSTFSFPSGHTMIITSMCLILMYLINKSNINKNSKRILNVVFIIIPLLVGVSRIYLGAHFFTDVIGAYTLSISLVCIITYFIDKKGYL